MNYKRTMAKIMELLAEYKITVDGWASGYLKEKGMHEDELKGMEGKYTPEYIAEYHKNWVPKNDYAKEIARAREKYQGAAIKYLDQIEKEMDAYFRIPVDSGFAATVTAVKSLGVTLSDREFRLLQGASGGYWGLRLLNELGTSRAKEGQEVKMENGQPEFVQKTVPTPYSAVALPDIEKIYASLQDVRNALNTAFEAYCGKDYVLKDIVFPLSKATEETNAKLAAAYGVHPQKQTHDTLTLSKMTRSEKYFDKNCTTYTSFINMLDELAGTMPKEKKKEVLTDSDRKLIDTIIDSKYESLAKSQAVEIAKADERLADILKLDRRYGAAVKAALEVSENE